MINVFHYVLNDRNLKSSIYFTKIILYFLLKNEVAFYFGKQLKICTLLAIKTANISLTKQ